MWSNFLLMNDQSISLNKYISSTGRCSRREADVLIKAGRVSINDLIASSGNRVSPGDEVYIDGEQLNVTSKKAIYIAFNKPVGVICTTEHKISNNIVDFIKHPRRIFPIGRLDKPSEGLIFMTSDGDIVNKILRAGNQHQKEYIVSVDKPITPDFINKMSNGIPILDTITQKCMVEQLGKHSFRIILTQGLNRQIRRMCTHLEYAVTRLQRVRIMNVTLEGLAPGEWRELTAEEMELIDKMIATSSKTEEASHIPTPSVTVKKQAVLKKEPVLKKKRKRVQRKPRSVN